ncbi:MAG: PAS domain S-box protein [Bacteroidales bacterium]|nr:PAS domain S-box protein [Bacteroidales bacterium]
MKSRLKLRQKIIVILISIAIIFALIIAFIGDNSKDQIQNVTTDLVDTKTQKYAELAQNELNQHLHTTEYLKQTFENYRIFPEEKRREILSGMLKETLKANQDLLSAWGTLKPNSIDQLDSIYKNQKGSTIAGNFRYIYYRNNGTIQLNDYIEQNPNKILTGKGYSKVENSEREMILEPFYHSYSGLEENEVFKTNIIAPIMDGSRFIGAVGVDLSLSPLQEMVGQFQPFQESFAFLFSQSGKLVAFPEMAIIGNSIENTGLVQNDRLNFQNKIKQGKSFSFHTTYGDDEEHYVSVAPVELGNTNKQWFVGVASPEKVISGTAGGTINNSLLIALIGLIIIGLVVWYMSDDIIKSIQKLIHVINKIAIGDVNKSMKLNIDSADEIGQAAHSLNKYIDGYVNKTEFASKISAGELDTELTPLSEKDLLSKSLIEVKNSLQKAKEEEKKRQEEDRKRQWSNEGVAKFADLLRHNNDDLDKLSYSIISNLVKYLEANQGGIFLLNDEDDNEQFYELKASIAYDRRKYINKQIKPGEGLVGTCAIEGETIYMTDIPQDYINITSGLGEANPDSLLIAPLKTEEEILGVLEIASFNKFEQYQIDFVEKVAESIASTISSVKINIRTNQLLEKSQQQAEEMKSQEEEMRQNMEEMQSTQEELSRKNQENEKMQKELAKEKALLDALMDNLPDFIYFKDKESKFIRISKSMLPLFPVDSIDNMIGKSDFDFHKPEAAQEMYEEEQEIIRKEQGFKDKIQHEVTESGQEQWVSVSKLPLYDENGNLMGTFGISKDITQFKQMELEANKKTEKLEERLKELESYQQEAVLKSKESKGLIDVIDSLMWRAELDENRKIVSTNNLFLNGIGFSDKELEEKNFVELIMEKDKEKFNEAWEKLKQGNTQKITLQLQNKSGEMVNLFISLIPVSDKEEKFYKALFLANENGYTNS